jgi:tetratricopeptide (TPR) repeat protein
LRLGKVLLADGRVEEAESVFRQLLGMKPDSQTLHDAGVTLLGFERYALARDFLEQAAPGHPASRPDLAIALFFTAGPERALRALERTPEAEQDGDYWLLKARILDAAGHAAEAEKALREGLRHTVLRPEVARQAALLLVRLNRKEEALDLLGQAIQSSPDHPELPLTRTIILGLLGRSTEAEKAVLAMESRWPEWDRPYLVHGLLLELAERPKEARQKLQTAAALGSPDRAAECGLARLSNSETPPHCACAKGLYELLFPACDETH